MAARLLRRGLTGLRVELYTSFKIVHIRLSLMDFQCPLKSLRAERVLRDLLGVVVSTETVNTFFYGFDHFKVVDPKNRYKCRKTRVLRVDFTSRGTDPVNGTVKTNIPLRDAPAVLLRLPSLFPAVPRTPRAAAYHIREVALIPATSPRHSPAPI